MTNSAFYSGRHYQQGLAASQAQGRIQKTQTNDLFNVVLPNFVGFLVKLGVSILHIYCDNRHLLPQPGVMLD